MMPKNIKDRYDEPLDEGKVGSSSKATRPIKNNFLVPVWDADANKGRVAVVPDLLSDNSAFVMTMVLSNAYVLVAGTAVYDGSDNLVSAEIQWADGRGGTIERTMLDLNGSYKDLLTRAFPGAATKTYAFTQLIDDGGRKIGGGWGSSGGGIPQLVVAETLLPFTTIAGQTPDELETNTGIQRITVTTTNTEKEAVVAAPEGWGISIDEGYHWNTLLSFDASGGVDVLLRFKEETVGSYSGSMYITVGEAYQIVDLTAIVGDGTAGNKAPVVHPCQLASLMDNPTLQYIQMNDLDLSGYQSGTGWEPIGNTDTDPFTGYYDGDGYKITGLVTAPTNYAGLFGFLSGATIMDLTVESASVSGVSNTGVLAGYAETATITNCHVSGKAESSASNVGGLIGFTALTSVISNCSSSVAVTGSGTATNLGGLIGAIASTTISQCIATGAVTGIGSGKAGGLVGNFSSGTATNCYATGAVDAVTAANGGFVGYYYIIGCAISDCYSVGAVSGATANGGFVGAKGPITTNLHECFWDETTSGQTGGIATMEAANKLTGYVTADMYKEATFNGWDFTTVWAIVEDTSYPTLQWEAV
jgi:hypothetical protein